MNRNRRMAVAIILAAVALDQLTKWLVLTRVDIPTGGMYPVLPFLALVHFWNHGVSFGFLNAMNTPDTQRYVLIVATFAIVMALAVALSKARHILSFIGLSLVIGGALGNIADRIVRGAVADFLYFHYGKYDFPAFNVADSCVTVGVGILLIESLFVKADKSVKFTDAEVGHDA